ncbi:T9SS type A sorting domain-containing protein [Adhaeribacter terreus]|uniref:T9SS type A sorting domain-containing protein n=1 Tax=Adhaeribacter terreus TaxID=529703 RepID=A0ABW0E5F9_9BACT
MKKFVLIALGLLSGYGARAQSANDAGVNAINSPMSSVTANSSQPVSVTVKNFGTGPLTSATLGFSVNGVVQPTFAWSGNLATNGVTAAVAIGNFTFPAGAHVLKAWSKLPNGVTDGNAANDTTTISVFSCTTLSGNYTINKNAAASATNFTSVIAAVQALATCGVSGPVTFTVAPNSGPYAGVVTLPVISGTSATNKITFEGNGNIISGSGTQGLLTFNGADHVKVNNFRLDVDQASTGHGVFFTNASDNDIVSNCTVNLSVASTALEQSGIRAGASGGNNANNLLLQNNIVNGGTYGIILFGNASTTGNQIVGNIVRDPRAYGIVVSSGGSGTLIEGNDISRPTRINTQSLYGISLTGTTINTIVNKNRIHNTHDMASSTLTIVRGIHTSSSAPAGSENIIKNNLIYNINNNGGPLDALLNEGGSGTFYYHNTVSADNPNIIYTIVRGLNITQAASNLKFNNNIVSLTASSGGSFAIYLGSSGISLASNYNNMVVGGSGHIGYSSSVNFTTLTDWKVSSGGIYDQNSLSVDPLFVSPTYLQPLAPALNNSGQPLPAVTDAINGITRSTTTPDMGAYEFTPVVNDAGVTAITSPTSPLTPGVSQSVQVTLKNFGTATLTSATIGWKVNNVTQTPYSWTGSLNSLQATSAPVSIGNYTFPTGNATVKVWSQNPNAAADGLAVNDTTILNIVSCAPLAGNYTINKNNPTAGANFQSFAEVVQKLNSCGVAGPVVITVAAGTGPYNEQVELMNIPYTSATNTVTFEGSGNTVSVTPGLRPGIFVLNGAKFVKVNNFVFTLPTGVTTGWGVQLLNAADNNTISNNTINLPVGNYSSVSGITAGADLFSKGNNTSFTKIQNNIITGGGTGIKILGAAEGMYAVNNQITGNQVKDSYYYGISINDANGTLVESNDISRPTLTVSGNFTGIEVVAVSKNSIVSKNRIHNTHDMVAPLASTTNTYGISISNAATAPGNENIIKNNLIYKINSKGGNLLALYNTNSHGTYFDNNTVATDPTDSYSTINGMYFNGNINNVKFRNNIISLPSAVTNSSFGINVTGNAISLESNNNDFHMGTAGFVGYLVGVPKLTLADWKAVNGNAYDQNSVTINPLFTNYASGDLKPTAPTLDNLGQPLVNVTDDFMGVTRNITTPDMGAYEFIAVGNDVGIVAVSGPDSTICGLSVAETISVTIKNFGATTQTSIPVTYSVNGVAIAAPETFTGSIASNATATYTFNTKANLATAGNYQITATTQLTGDNIVNNNQNNLDITNYLLPTLPVKMDFETVNTGISNFRTVVKPNSAVKVNNGGSNGTGTKGMIMDGVDHAGWVTPTGATNPWTTNPDNFAAVYLCASTGTGAATDSLILTFDMKQLFKTAIENTNFRITVNGTQVGQTYQPVSGTNTWQKVKVNLNAYINDPTIQIGFESSVKETYDNGAGTANLIDNIEIKRVAGPTGVKDAMLAAHLNVFPNPSNGIFNIELPEGKTYEFVVTDLTGKVLMKHAAKGGTNQLNLEGTAKGIYLLKVSGEKGFVVRKLIVE